MARKFPGLLAERNITESRKPPEISLLDTQPKHFGLVHHAPMKPSLEPKFGTSNCSIKNDHVAGKLLLAPCLALLFFYVFIGHMETGYPWFLTPNHSRIEKTENPVDPQLYRLQ